MSVEKFTQTPITLRLEFSQRLRRFIVVNIELSKNRRDSPAIIVLLEDAATGLGNLKIFGIRGRQNLLRIVTDKIQVDSIDTDVLKDC